MNGPEHFREGDKILADLESKKVTVEVIQALSTQALAHYTAALVAARLPLPRDHRAWADVLNGESE
jgi:hypothetical protein